MVPAVPYKYLLHLLVMFIERFFTVRLIIQTAKGTEGTMLQSVIGKRTRVTLT